MPNTPLAESRATPADPPRPNARRPFTARRLTAVVILFALLLRLPGLRGDFTDQDSWRQTDTATVARNFLRDPRILYPRINWGAPGPGYVESEFALYPFAVSLLYRVLGPDPIYGRLLSVALTGASCAVLLRIARRFLPEPQSLLTVVFFATAPIVFRFSRAFMPEATVLLFYLLALEIFLRFLDSGTWRSLLAAACAMSLAILVKPTSIHLGLTLMILAAAKDSWRSWLRPKLLAFAAVALLPAAAYFAHAASLHLRYGNTFGVISGGDPKWGGPRWWFDPRFYWRLTTIDTFWIAGPVGSILALLGVVTVKRLAPGAPAANGRPAEMNGEVGRVSTPPTWGVLAAAWAAAIFAYYLIVARYASFALQYHLYAAPLLAMAAAAGAGWVRRATRAAWPAALLVCAVLGYQAYADAGVLAYRKPLLRDAGRALAKVARPGDLAVVLSHDPAVENGVPNNYQEPDVFFHADLCGRSLPRDEQTPADLLREVSCGARWFVNFPDLNAEAAPGFGAYLKSSMTLVAADPASRFEIYEVRDPPGAGRPH